METVFNPVKLQQRARWQQHKVQRTNEWKWKLACKDLFLCLCVLLFFLYALVTLPMQCGFNLHQVIIVTQLQIHASATQTLIFSVFCPSLMHSWLLHFNWTRQVWGLLGWSFFVLFFPEFMLGDLYPNGLANLYLLRCQDCLVFKFEFHDLKLNLKHFWLDNF